MDVYRRSRSQGRLPSQVSPPYREYDNSGYDYFFDRPVERSHRSRSLDNRRDFQVDDYLDDVDERSFQRIAYQHTTVPKRNYEYQPYLNVNTQFGNEPRPVYHEDVYLDQLSPIDSRQKQAYSSRVAAEYDWGALDRSIRNYRGESATLPARRYPPSHQSKFQAMSPRSGGGSSKKHNLMGFFSDDRQRARRTAPTPKPNDIYGHKSEGGRVQTLSYEDTHESFAAPASGYSHQRSYHHESRSYGGNTAGTASGGYPGGPMPLTKGGTYGNERSIYANRYGSDEQKYYKIHCCCMSFRWPPWRYEEVEPPQPMYRHQ
uniref:LSR n=1 Tax=Ascaris lumbricoides TaxID=6252 RepID=A0A0M3HRT6_ASCLU